MTGAGKRSYDFGSRTNDAQNTSLRVPLWQIVLLNGTQCFGRCSIATQHNQLTSHLEKTFNGLTSKLIDYIERTSAIGSTGIVAQVEIVVLGQQLTNTMQNGQSAVSTIKYSYGTWCTGKQHGSLLFQQIKHILSHIYPHFRINKRTCILVGVDNKCYTTQEPH